MIWNLIGSIGGKVLDIVDDVVEDKDEAYRGTPKWKHDYFYLESFVYLRGF